MRHLVSQFYNSIDTREAVKSFLELEIEKRIISDVKAGIPTEAHGIALKMINSSFASMRKEFQTPKAEKVNVNQNK